jgi:hypothetical protein
MPNEGYIAIELEYEGFEISPKLLGLDNELTDAEGVIAEMKEYGRGRKNTVIDDWALADDDPIIRVTVCKDGKVTHAQW